MINKFRFNVLPTKTLCSVFIIFHNTKYADIGKRAGFYCDDESIKKPYHGDTIHIVYLFTVLIVVYGLIIYVTESLLKHEKNHPDKEQSKFKIVSSFYFSGLLYVLGITELLKVFVSEVRPHFFYTCVPDMDNIDCSKGWITEFNCTNTGQEWLIKRDIFKSFPSGHASLSIYALVFLCTYLHRNGPRHSFGVWWLRIIYCFCFLWTFACCSTRILDNRHFWWDVLIGALIGLVGGVIQVKISERKLKECFLQNTIHLEKNSK